MKRFSMSRRRLLESLRTLSYRIPEDCTPSDDLLVQDVIVGAIRAIERARRCGGFFGDDEKKLEVGFHGSAINSRPDDWSSRPRGFKLATAGNRYDHRVSPVDTVQP